jgi:hypothetical protein
VIVVTTADRVDSLLDHAWAPETVAAAGAYTGRHRLAGFRVAFTVRRMFYIAKHRR